MYSKKPIKLIALCILSVVSAISAYAQTTVTGTVIDDSGNPVVGATVIIPGTTRGTSTATDGTYSINAGDSESLEFSCIGYKTQTIVLNGRSIIEVILEDDNTLLDETVVVGYGVQKKVNLTGAVSMIKSEDIENRAAINVTNLLQGTMAGLNVTTSEGTPGASASVNVRGYTSINGGSPLVLVDGSISALDYVNPNDIESISVIKDASAAAVYGGRAAFGVILVTTKEANTNARPKVKFSGRWGWTEPTTRTDYETRGYWSVYTVQKFYYNRHGSNYIDYTDNDMMQLLARVNDKTENPDRPWVIEEVRNGRNQWVYYCNTDWWHSLFQDQRPSQSYNINISGGAKGVKYMISGGYERQEGMMKVNTDIYQKYNLRAKLDADITKWLKFSNNTSLFSSKYTSVGPTSIDNTLGYMSKHALACFPLFNPDGSGLYSTPYIGYKIANGRHIIAYDGNHRNSERTMNLQNTSSLEITFAPTLKLTGDFTYRLRQTADSQRSVPVYYREYPDGDLLSYDTGAGLNRLREYMYNYQWYTTNAYLSYDETNNNAHHLAVTAGLNYEYYYYKRLGGYATNLISIDLDDFALVGSDENGETIQYVYGNQHDYALMGYFARINYDYKERYLVELSGRYDGSSRFAKGNRWGFFPSASAGWRISEEPFFEPARNVVDNLKIRASFGSLGNQNVSSYYAYARLISTSNMSYSFNEGSGFPKYATIDDPVAGDLTWETVQQYDVGIDLDMFGNRLNFTADGYIRNTLGMLTDGMDLPSVYGAGVPEMNSANLTTRGYEISISWKDHFMLGGHLFQYSIGGNISDYASFITKFDGNDEKLLSNHYVGQRLGSIWGYKTDGLLQTQAEVDEYISTVDVSYINYPNGVQVGDVKFVDVNGDGAIGIGSNTLDDPGDRVLLGNSQISLQYGFNASVNYCGFDVSVFFQGTGNHYYYPNSQDMQFWGCYTEPFVTFLQKDFLKRCWSTDNPDAYFPVPMASESMSSGYLYQTNDRYLQNARYLRLKNLTVGYTVPEKLTKKISIEKVRVYFTGENLCYWSPLDKYAMGYIDPEALTNTRDDYGDYNYYPWSKTIMFGIDITF